jgi:hypothetical protein
MFSPRGGDPEDAKPPGSRESTAVETKPTGPQPVKVVAITYEKLLEDFEQWKYLRDVELQLSILESTCKELGEGVFTRDFLEWLEKNMVLQGGEEEKRKKWHNMRNSEKALLVARYVSEKKWMHVFNVIREGGVELYIVLGYNDVVLPVSSGERKGDLDFGEKLLNLMFSPLLGPDARRETLVTLANFAGKTIRAERLNPIDKWRFGDYILDLSTYEFIEPVSPGAVEPDYYFTNYSPLFTTRDRNVDGKTLKEILKDIKEGKYDITKNKFHKAYRQQFDYRNWLFFINLVGNFTEPHNVKLIGQLVGPTNSTKSTILSLLGRPIKGIVGVISSVNKLGENRFALQHLLDKQIIFSYEGIEKAPVELLNNMFGKSDEIPVERKFKPPVTRKSWKLGVFASNSMPDLRYLSSKGLDAFLNRLMVIEVKPLNEEAIDEEIEKKIDDVEIMAFILWCGWLRRKCKEKRAGWKIPKPSEEELWEKFLEEKETVEKFLNSEEVILSTGSDTKGDKVYAVYKEYTIKVLKKRPLSLTDFYGELEKLESKYGIHVHRKGNVVWIAGLKLARDEKTRRK